jgi:hypothetical protein
MNTCSVGEYREMKQNERPTGLSRRTAVKIMAVGMAGLATGGGLTTLAIRMTRQGPRPWRFFTEAEAALVIELCEQIIPRDDTPRCDRRRSCLFPRPST